MMHRITKAQLDSLVARINHALGVSCDPYASDGGWRLEQMCKGGGSRDLLSTGYESKRHIYAIASAYLAGLESRQ